MKPITIRGISEKAVEYIKSEARAKKLSLNKVVVSIVDQAAGQNSPSAENPKTDHHDLDALFGVWTTPEGAEFDESIRGFRSVDEELWKDSR
jgi:hypothetical protein